VNDGVIFLLSLVVTVVICAAIFFVRRGMQSQAWKDFLGIAIAFVVLALATLTMIIGEHALG
jgi:uncharacterized protein (DUF983 family)